MCGECGRLCRTPASDPPRPPPACMRSCRPTGLVDFSIVILTGRYALGFRSNKAPRYFSFDARGIQVAGLSDIPPRAAPVQLGRTASRVPRPQRCCWLRQHVMQRFVDVVKAELVVNLQGFVSLAASRPLLLHAKIPAGHTTGAAEQVTRVKWAEGNPRQVAPSSSSRAAQMQEPQERPRRALLKF